MYTYHIVFDQVFNCFPYTTWNHVRCKSKEDCAIINWALIRIKIIAVWCAIFRCWKRFQLPFYLNNQKKLRGKNYKYKEVIYGLNTPRGCAYMYTIKVSLKWLSEDQGQIMQVEICWFLYQEMTSGAITSRVKHKSTKNCNHVALYHISLIGHRPHLWS